MNIKSILSLLALVANGLLASAQTDSISPTVTFSAYVEPYYSFDFAEPADHQKAGFLYSHNRHNEFTLNLGLVKGAYSSTNVRANLALMAGTYANANLSGEPGVLKNIYEANAGVRLSRRQQLWIDAGIFPSHIGFERAIGKDNWTLTRSLAAETSPYYESGIRLSYTTPNGQWFFSGLVLNGWQHIQRPDGNNTPAFGTQITYKPTEGITLNSNTFIGNDKPDTARQTRFFHDFYAIFQVVPSFGITFGFDYGIEDRASGRGETNWYTPVVLLRYSPTDRLALTGRVEYYHDPSGTIVSVDSPTGGFRAFGYSLGMDYAVNSYALWRLEARGLRTEEEIFVYNNQPSLNNVFLTTSLAVTF